MKTIISFSIALLFAFSASAQNTELDYLKLRNDNQILADLEYSEFFDNSKFISISYSDSENPSLDNVGSIIFNKQSELNQFIADLNTIIYASKNSAVRIINSNYKMIVDEDSDFILVYNIEEKTCKLSKSDASEMLNWLNGKEVYLAEYTVDSNF